MFYAHQWVSVEERDDQNVTRKEAAETMVSPKERRAKYINYLTGEKWSKVLPPLQQPLRSLSLPQRTHPFRTLPLELQSTKLEEPMMGQEFEEEELNEEPEEEHMSEEEIEEGSEGEGEGEEEPMVNLGEDFEEFPTEEEFTEEEPIEEEEESEEETEGLFEEEPLQPQQLVALPQQAPSAPEHEQALRAAAIMPLTLPTLIALPRLTHEPSGQSELVEPVMSHSETDILSQAGTLQPAKILETV